VSHPKIGRFFSPLQALISVGIGVAGLGCAGLVVYRYYDGGRIPIMFVLIAAALLLAAPVHFATQAFPKGCKSCKRAFASKSVAFPSGWQEVIRRFLVTPDQATWQQLCQAPAHGQSERLLLEIEHCAQCHSIGEASLSVEEMRNSSWSTRDSFEETVIEGQMVGWLTQLAEVRERVSPA
jgi:hypothetical protein